MADDTEPKTDAGEDGDYDYSENDNAEDNPAQTPSVNSNDAVETTPVVPSQQPPSEDDNSFDDNAARDAAAADAANANAAQDGFEGDYDDEGPLPDVTVNLYINELPDAAVTDAVNYLTDDYGNPVGGWSKAVQDYTTTIAQDLVDGLEGNGTTTGKQGWLGSWSWSKSLLVGLIALCVIGIILTLVCIVIGKKGKRNNSGQGSGTATTTTKAVVTKGVNPDTKYAPVPTDV